jgi:hypothetical protein
MSKVDREVGAMNVVYAAAILPLGCFLLAGCSSATAGKSPPDPDAVVFEQADPPEELGVPAGQLPPPGECRVWYPNWPSGDQPAPESCELAEANAPAQTVVLYRPNHPLSEVHARVIDAKRPGIVVRVHIFDVQTGEYLRAGRP